MSTVTVADPFVIDNGLDANVVSVVKSAIILSVAPSLINHALVLVGDSVGSSCALNATRPAVIGPEKLVPLIAL